MRTLIILRISPIYYALHSRLGIEIDFIGFRILRHKCHICCIIFAK